MKTQNVVARVNGFTKTSETNPRVSSMVLTDALKLSFFQEITSWFVRKSYHPKS